MHRIFHAFTLGPTGPVKPTFPCKIKCNTILSNQTFVNKVYFLLLLIKQQYCNFYCFFFLLKFIGMYLVSWRSAGTLNTLYANSFFTLHKIHLLKQKVFSMAMYCILSEGVNIKVTFTPFWPGNPGTPSMPMGPGKPAVPYRSVYSLYVRIKTETKEKK